MVAQAVAPASPVRAEERRCPICQRTWNDEFADVCSSNFHLVEPNYADRVLALLEAKDAELAALRKRVDDGERDTKRLERLLSGNCWSVQRQWGDCGWQVYDPIQARVVGSGRTAKEALDDAATPEPKEPANG